MANKLTDTEIKTMVSACAKKVNDVKCDEFFEKIDNISKDDNLNDIEKFGVFLQYIYNSTHEIAENIITQALIEYNKN